MNWYFISSIISILLSLIFFSIAIGILYLNKKNRQKEIECKKQYNKLELIDFKGKIETINSFCSQNDNYESLISMTYDFHEEFKKKIMIVKDNLIYLSDLNSNLNIFKSRKITKKITKDLEVLSQGLNDHEEKIILGKKMYENISDILIEYIEINKELLFFYEKHLVRKYDNNFVLTKIKSLYDNFEKLNNMKKGFDLTFFFVLISSINRLLKEVASLFRLWYIFDKVCSYIKSNIDKIEHKLINESKTIRNIDSINVEKKLSIIKSKYFNIINELKFASFEEIEDDIKECISAIQDINSNIDYKIQTDIFYSEYLEFIVIWVNRISEEKDLIVSSLREIIENFDGNKRVQRQVISIIKNTEKLLLINKSLKQRKDIKNLAVDKYINFIIHTINLLYNWLISIDSLVKLLEDRHSDFSFIIKDISNLKFSIGKIIGSIHDYNIMDASIIPKLNDSFAIISNMEKQIKDDYNISFREEFYNNLLEWKFEIFDYKTYVEKEIKLKFFAEKLLTYSNQFIIKDSSFKNKIAIAENHYFGKNYKKTINYLLKEIRRFN
ncbi:MAG: hypothetical protein ACRCVI_00110 [Mycoplasmoidaceae bacterium]